ncbi:MAG: biopolymer transporter ExbD, partial [Pseudoalteromonas spongiae]
RPTALDLNRATENKQTLTQTVTPQFHITEDNRVMLNNKQIDPQSIAINLARLDANGDITAISVTADKESTHNTLVHLLNEIKGYTSAPVSLGSAL